MKTIRITVGPYRFAARMESAAAPATCAAFLTRLPWKGKLIHARWSGEACWVPLGKLDLGVGLENATSHPSRGDLLFHPAGASESEILFVYGSARFASKVGTLAGSHFLTIVEGMSHLEGMGVKVLWEGAQDVAFEVEPA